ncbi:MAG: transketolase [Acidobacteria bacterium]|nr:transketolase [Acidobacteriota bacterium]
MAVTTTDAELVTALEQRATQLRIDSIRATTEAGSGHPTSCASAAEIVSTLFFSVMRYDPAEPANPRSDVFLLSKGHAAPILYAAWSQAGFIPPEELLNLRKITSDLDGHPTPRVPFVDVATGSLGQGLSVGLGMALNARLEKSDQRIYVVLGDGESAEGSVWEAAAVASYHKVNNLCATIDINRLGQSDPTMLQHDLDAYAVRWEAFGWQALKVDGHSIPELLEAYERAARTPNRPTVVLARTIKGKGIAFAEDRMGWHGRALKKGEETDTAIGALQSRLNDQPAVWAPVKPSAGRGRAPAGAVRPPAYSAGQSVATREAFGAALAALGEANPLVVALDADVKNSTFSEEFLKRFPERFFEGFIAEQNMVGATMGFAAKGKIPFASTFACFFTRAYDFIRMAAISNSNIKLVGTHAGVSIGEDGPSQMGLEDLAMACAEPNFTVLYPADAVSTWRAVEAAAAIHGPVYIRTGRPKIPVIYANDEKFETGKCKVLRQSGQDRVTLVAAGVTVFEALKAHERLAAEGIAVRVVDLYSVQPIDREALRQAARATGGRVMTVEDHYAHGGIGDAVLAALAEDRVEVHKLAVREIPRSGKPEELLDRFGISANAIVAKAKAVVERGS